MEYQRKPIEGWEGYEIDTEGKVWSWKTNGGGRLDSPKLMKQAHDKDGYCRVSLTDRKLGKQYPVHRLVAAAFLENPRGLPQVCHIDGVKTNNQADNLRWDTAKGNEQDKYKHGTMHFGARNGNAKLAPVAIKQIAILRKSGLSLSVIANAFAVHKTTVYRVLNGDTWRGV